MIRTIIAIDTEKCNGCGQCANACHEGAIGIVDGKARLLREDYCDGLGNCLPACPTGAIRFEEREAPAYDEAAVRAAQKEAALPCGCPGSACQTLKPSSAAPDVPSQLRNFPIQIKLVPVNAPYFNGADLLIAADCAAYACGNFHSAFMRGRVTLIGCPKLDAVDYSEKLAQILTGNEIRSVLLTRMTVPCCGGLLHAVKTALERSGKIIPLRAVIMAPDGHMSE
ncbi:MAG: 4Fe-4S binding protein [Desulfovibrionaceae bacterium]|nr:4Fe-4S binding protein [Desulfovibrionaceae bacterium]